MMINNKGVFIADLLLCGQIPFVKSRKGVKGGKHPDRSPSGRTEHHLTGITNQRGMTVTFIRWSYISRTINFVSRLRDTRGKNTVATFRNQHSHSCLSFSHLQAEVKEQPFLLNRVRELNKRCIYSGDVCLRTDFSKTWTHIYICSHREQLCGSLSVPNVLTQKSFGLNSTFRRTKVNWRPEQLVTFNEVKEVKFKQKDVSPSSGVIVDVNLLPSSSVLVSINC